MQPTLLILAAGMASRYGSMKQTQGFGPNGETIMEYSIYDAIRAGFEKVVFIIREEFVDMFRSNFGAKLEGKIEVAYVFQEKDRYLPAGFSVPADRTKPWGTAHAVLCAANDIQSPFAVINADDFYGADGFVKAVDFLRHQCNPETYAIIGYELAKTLSEHGTVSRGVCAVNDQGNLVSIKERTKIYREGNRIVYEEEDGLHEVPVTSPVSMNFWCFHPAMFAETERQFHRFVTENGHSPKAEFFIPLLGDEFVNKAGGNIRVIPTSAQWFGVTYKEDAPAVQASINALIQNGTYPAALWA